MNCLYLDGAVNKNRGNCKSLAEVSALLIISSNQRGKKNLFRGLKHGRAHPHHGKTRVNIGAALTTIKARPTGPLNTGRRFRALSGGSVYGRRVDIIANAVDHRCYLTQLRMIVNNLANDLQRQVTALLPVNSHQEKYRAPQCRHAVNRVFSAAASVRRHPCGYIRH